MKQTLDTLFINDLQLPCLIGIFDAERKEKQMVIINVELSTDLRKAGKTDKIDDTISYHDVYVQIVELVEQSKFFLLESLAEAIASLCLKNKKIKYVKVHIEKPKALKLGKSAAIEIIRTNDK